MSVNRDRVKEITSGNRAIFDIFKQFKNSTNPIDLSIGNPHLKPSKEYCETYLDVINEMVESENNEFGYEMGPDPHGVCTMIAQRLNIVYNRSFSAKNIVMTVGATSALDSILGTIIEKSDIEDEVIVLQPCFLEYCSIIKNNGATPVLVNCDESFDISISGIEKAITSRTTAIIINSPNNPTGRVYSQESLAELAALLLEKSEQHGTRVTVIEDAVYDTIVEENKTAPSMIDTWNKVIRINSFSKSVRIAGERLGYLAIHPHYFDSSSDIDVITEAIRVTARTRVVHPSSIQQKIIARMGDTITADSQLYFNNAEALCSTLNELDFKATIPQGTFYVWTELPDYFESEEQFRVFASEGDSTLIYMPGTLFGGEKFRRYVRFSACVKPDVIEKAIEKLRSISVEAS